MSWVKIQAKCWTYIWVFSLFSISVSSPAAAVCVIVCADLPALWSDHYSWNTNATALVYSLLTLSEIFCISKSLHCQARAFSFHTTTRIPGVPDKNVLRGLGWSSAQCEQFLGFVLAHFSPALFICSAVLEFVAKEECGTSARPDSVC